MSSTAPILAFDTALGECSVALWRAGVIAARQTVKERNQQTRLLAPMVEQVMRENCLSYSELQGIATTSGPGSFTGIRIGLAMARGLAFAAKKPLFAVTTLELLGWQAYRSSSHDKLPIVSAINAYRSQVYLQGFHSKEGFTALTPARILFAGEIAAVLPEEPFLLAGDCASLLATQIPPGRYRLSESAQSTDAAALAEYAALRGFTETASGSVAPFYLRPPDAKPQKKLLRE